MAGRAPTFLHLLDDGHQLMDIDGDGSLDKAGLRAVFGVTAP